MILFHGTNTTFDLIDLSKGKNFKDFGKGFYTTQIETQERKWAIALKERFALAESFVQSYELNESKLAKLHVLRFEEPNLDWAHFVINNRNFQFSNFSDPLNNHKNQYDIVEGPVADDRIAVILDQFLINLISRQGIIGRIEL